MWELGEAYCNTAAVALLLYETCITFDRELQLVWKRRLSAATWIFFLNRYLVIALYVVNLIATFRSSLHYDCRILLRSSQTLGILPYVVWAVFSSLRTWALTNRGWYAALVVFALCFVPVPIYIFRDTQGHPSHLTHPISCMIFVNYPFILYKRWTAVSRSCLILADILVLSVTWAKTYDIVRLAGENDLDLTLSLTTILLRDGSIYFIVWTILNALHIVATYIKPIRYITVFTDAFTSILVSRFILNLRGADTYRAPTLGDTAVDAHFTVGEGPPDRFANSWTEMDRDGAGLPPFLAPLSESLNYPAAELSTGDMSGTTVSCSESPGPPAANELVTAVGKGRFRSRRES